MTIKPFGRVGSIRPLLLLMVAVVLAVVWWSYASTLGETARRWARDPQYSHGYLVPVFALVLLWLRRDRLPAEWPPWTWWGVPVLAVGLGLRLFGTYFHFVWLDPISLLPCLAGLCLLLGGWAAWRWAWPAIVFLAFMIPLPHSAAVAMSGSLQRIATLASTFALQTLGLPALAEGNTILLDDLELGVVEACSGLRMLVVFFALSTGVALLIRRRLWEKLLIVGSAVPIALASNVIRITATGVLHRTLGSELANAFFHDVAGWLMMPLALGMLWLELKILDRLLIEPAASRPVRGAVIRPRGARPSVPARPERPAVRTSWPPKPAMLRPAGE
ncbi:MAG TPA: exosortase/archaeosortase family protein [Gemmataceae bacterium]|nr:exosortase/archaeosortase family protein [Gemmataceae bacterium]